MSLANSKILVTRSSMPDYNEYCDEIKALWDSHWLTNMGVKHNELEAILKNYLQVKDVRLMVNGHMALEMTLQAFNLRGEVITTPFTFASTTHSIVRSQLKPVFCDIDPITFCIDVNKIEALITDQTTAIMPVHVYGNICNVEAIQRIAEKYDLKVIYDAAHAFGVKYHDRGIASYGDASCFSFHATKVFNTIEGGAVCFSNEQLGDSLSKLRDFGIRSEEVIDGIGANAKMNEFAAAMGICNMRHFETEILKREKVVKKYRELLENIDGIQLNVLQDGVKTNYAYFPIVIDEKIFGVSRNELFKKLKENGIYARKYFYPLTNSLDCFHGSFDISDTPIALHISKRVLTLPLYADMDEETVERICKTIIECKKF